MQRIITSCCPSGEGYRTALSGRQRVELPTPRDTDLGAPGWEEASRGVVPAMAVDLALVSGKDPGVREHVFGTSTADDAGEIIPGETARGG